jgi:hypothetical protein
MPVIGVGVGAVVAVSRIVAYIVSVVVLAIILGSPAEGRRVRISRRNGLDRLSSLSGNGSGLLHRSRDSLRRSLPASSQRGRHKYGNKKSGFIQRSGLFFRAVLLVIICHKQSPHCLIFYYISQK